MPPAPNRRSSLNRLLPLNMAVSVAESYRRISRDVRVHSDQRIASVPDAGPMSGRRSMGGMIWPADRACQLDVPSLVNTLAGLWRGQNVQSRFALLRRCSQMQRGGYLTGPGDGRRATPTPPGNAVSRNILAGVHVSQSGSHSHPHQDRTTQGMSSSGPKMTTSLSRTSDVPETLFRAQFYVNLIARRNSSIVTRSVTRRGHVNERLPE